MSNPNFERYIRQFVSASMRGQPSNKARLLANTSHLAIAINGGGHGEALADNDA